MASDTADIKFDPIATMETRKITPFAAATLVPAALLLLGAALGGLWTLPALVYLTLFTHILDLVTRSRAANAPDTAEFPTANKLAVVLGFLHFALLVLALWALVSRAGYLGWSWVPLFLAFGLYFGQVSNSVAHELIHRTDRDLFNLGKWVYISLLFGHHTSAHRLVHHRYVATPDDPSTAEEGEHFWDYLVRAWPGAFLAGYELEAERLKLRADRPGRFAHPYAGYLGGAALFVFLVTYIFGFAGLAVYLLLVAHAQLQLLLSDYVQHYGLLRRKETDGGYEPAGAAHSWDAPHAFSGWLMLNAPRHGDHHAHPARPYPELQLQESGRGPVLPYSLPVMATIALFPRLWRRVMHPALVRWRNIAANPAR